VQMAKLRTMSVDQVDSFLSRPGNLHRKWKRQKVGRFFLSPLENIEYHQIEPNSVYVWIFTHSFCSEGDLRRQSDQPIYLPKDPRNGNTAS
jgi:hypothetical protein